MAMLLFCYPVQQWTLALYTEAFFTSMSILFVERISRTERAAGWTIALALITVFARPVGMLFVGPALLWKFAHSPILTRLKPWLPVGYATILLLGISLPGIRAPQLEPIVDAHIIAGIPRDSGALAQFEGSSILSAQIFLMERHGLAEWSMLFLRRTASLFTLARPYYSITQNLLKGVWMLLYPIALWGIWRQRKQPPLQLLIGILILNTMLVGLTHDEWNGRFIVPLFPWIMVLAVAGAVKQEKVLPAMQV